MKQTVPYEELLEKVQFVVRACRECRNIHIDNLQVYPEQVNGANWNIVTWRRSGDDNDLTACRESVMLEIRSLRQQYDVAS